MPARRLKSGGKGVSSRAEAPGDAPDAQSRRDVILEAAAELFAAKGIAVTTVRQIADQAGILSGSLYHHFPSKQRIVEEILTTYLEDLQKSYAEVLAEELAPADQLRSLIRRSLETAVRHPHAAEIYQRDHGYLQTLPHFDYLENVARDVQKAWLQVINAGVASGDFRDEIDPRVFYRMLRDAVWLSVRWYQPRPGYSVSQFADDAASVFLDGFAVRPTSRRR